MELSGGAGNVLYLGLDGGYTDVYIWKHLLDCPQKSYMLNYIHVMPQLRS